MTSNILSYAKILEDNLEISNELLSFFNTEIKCGIYASMNVDSLYTTIYGLKNKMETDICSDDVNLVPSGSTFMSFFESLENKGYFLAEVNSIVNGGKDTVTSYRLNEKGLKYLPLAKFMLKASVDDNDNYYNETISLHDIFGQSSSRNSVSGPYNAAKLLAMLYDKGEMEFSELSKDIGKFVRNHILRLEEHGFINYDQSDKSHRIVSLTDTGKHFMETVLVPFCQYLDGEEDSINIDGFDDNKKYYVVEGMKISRDRSPRKDRFNK